jgi:hypothetical protein
MNAIQSIAAHAHQTGAKGIKAYIAGPMTGLPDLNFKAFFRAAHKLRAYGIEVVNPAEINIDQSMEWHECMRKDIAALVECNTIVMLRGWQASKGATLEHHIATRLGMDVVFEEQSL